MPRTARIIILLGQGWLSRRAARRPRCGGSTGSTIRLAQFYLREKKFDDAIRVLQEAGPRDPRNPNLALWTAMAFEQANRWEDARKSYERVIELDPDNLIAQNNLASIIAERGGNMDVALGLAQKAKEKQPENVNITNTLGWILYKKNSYQLSLQYLKEAAEKQNLNPLYQYHLGMVYVKLGKTVEAKQALQKALTLDPQFSEAASAKQTLAQL